MLGFDLGNAACLRVCLYIYIAFLNIIWWFR